MVVTSLKNVNGFQPNQVRKSQNSCEIESCVKTGCPSHTHFASRCKSPRACSVDQCSISRKHLRSLYDALPSSFRRRQEENREQGPSVGSSSNLAQPQSDHFVMKSSTSIAVGSHDYKALPIVPVKVKGRGSGGLHMPCSITAKHRHRAVRVWSRS